MSATTLEVNKASPMRTLFRWIAPVPAPVPTPKLVEAKPAAKPVQSRGKKILIVDDDALILKTAALKLEAEGYAVVSAMEGAAAIRAARREKPDLILLDLSFPSDVGAVVWDGFLIMSWLRRLEEARDIPIIIITAGESSACRQRSLSAGATAFFHKPIAHDNLLAVIERTLGQEAGKRRSFPAGDFQI